MSEGNPNKPVPFSPSLQQVQSGAPPPVYVPPGVDPVVATRRLAAAARRSALPKYTTPVAGGESPPIPRLDGLHRSDMTMAEQAEHVNSPPQHQQVQSAMSQHQQVQGSIIEPPNLGGPRPTMQFALQPGDQLPEEAMRDPAFQKGMGSSAAASQPHLVQRYGVVRNGLRIAPQALMMPAPGRGPQAAQGRALPRGAETLRDLQDVHRLSTQNLPKTEEQADAQPPPEEKSDKKPLTDDQVRTAVSNMDSFEYDQLRKEIIKNELTHPEQRKLIESRLEPLSIDDLIMSNRVSQVVPVIPGRFSIKFTSMTGDDELALKRLLMLENKSVEVTEEYLLSKFAFMTITLGVTAINNNPLPSHLDNDGVFNDEKYWAKFKWMMQRPLHMLASIGANHGWFESRVRRLFVAEKVGNG